MPCVRVGDAVICFNHQYRLRDSKGRMWRFEFNALCGPTIFNSKGDAVDFPNENSPFWAALTAWIQGGQKYKQEKGYRRALIPSDSQNR